MSLCVTNPGFTGLFWKYFSYEHRFSQISRKHLDCLTSIRVNISCIVETMRILRPKFGHVVEPFGYIIAKIRILFLSRLPKCAQCMDVWKTYIFLVKHGHIPRKIVGIIFSWCIWAIISYDFLFIWSDISGIYGIWQTRAFAKPKVWRQRNWSASSSKP